MVVDGCAVNKEMQLLNIEYLLKINEEISQHSRVLLLLPLKVSTGDTIMTLNEHVSLDAVLLPLGKYYLRLEANLEP